jgi:hypothetical protein
VVIASNITGSSQMSIMMALDESRNHSISRSCLTITFILMDLLFYAQWIKASRSSPCLPPKCDDNGAGLLFMQVALDHWWPLPDRDILSRRILDLMLLLSTDALPNPFECGLSVSSQSLQYYSALPSSERTHDEMAGKANGCQLLPEFLQMDMCRLAN